jgi:hypothetical protein
MNSPRAQPQYEHSCTACSNDFIDEEEPHLFCQYCGKPRAKIGADGNAAVPTLLATVENDESFNWNETSEPKKLMSAPPPRIAEEEDAETNEAAPQANFQQERPGIQPIVQQPIRAAGGQAPPDEDLDFIMVEPEELEFETQIAEGSSAVVWSGQYQDAPAALKKVKYNSKAETVAGEDTKEDIEMKREVSLQNESWP